MRAIIYCRVSTKEQVQNLSLATQNKECTRYCIANGYEVDCIFVDEGESAKTAERPEFKKLLDYCRTHKGNIQAVVVYSLSRFSRNTNIHLIYRTLLLGYGITLRSVTEPTDESSTGKFIETMFAAIAQLDNDVKAERTIAGMRAALERGRWTFQAPIGYLNSPSPAGQPSLIPDPERGPLVLKAFELYATGHYQKNNVLRVVSNLGLLTRKGKKVTSQTFNKMLRNRLYAGWISVPKWGESKRGDFKPLVSQEVFEQVQMVLDGKRISLTPHVCDHPDFPLRRFVRCGKCGKPLTASWSKGRAKAYPYYRCPNSQCKGVNARKEIVEKEFMLLLERLQPKPEYLRLFTEIVLDVWRGKQADALLQRAAIEKQLAALKERKEQLIEAFVYQGAIDKATFQDQLDKLKEEMTLAEIELNEARLEELDVEAVLTFSQYVFLNAGRLWAEASLDQKQRLQGVLFSGGVTFSNGTFGTAKTCLAFNLLETPMPLKDDLVSPTGPIKPRSAHSALRLTYSWWPHDSSVCPPDSP